MPWHCSAETGMLQQCCAAALICRTVEQKHCCSMAVWCTDTAVRIKIMQHSEAVAVQCGWTSALPHCGAGGLMCCGAVVQNR